MVKLTSIAAIALALTGFGAQHNTVSAKHVARHEDLSSLFRSDGPAVHHVGLKAKKRQSTTATTTLPRAGATSGNGKPYPPAGDKPLKKSTIPRAWIKRYNSKKNAGLIPDIPQTREGKDGIVAYPASADSSNFCSWSRTNCIDGDIGQNAPQGYATITFDDGPTPYSADLGKFLADNKQSSTHFLIGSAILNNPDAFAEMIKYKDLMQFGIHTTTHSLQTTKTDLQIVADLGWTAQMIYDATGLVPLYWRAPEGDVDARVRAIAKEVFGLQHVIWNRDADDWCMNPSGGPETSIDTCKTQSFDKVVNVYKGWAHNSTLEGINVLMHETKPSTVNAFKQFYAELKTSKYKIGSVADVLNAPAYQNQFKTTDTAEEADSILPTREPIDFSDGGMHQVGTSGGATLGEFANLQKASSGSSSTGSGSGLQAGSGTGSAASSSAVSGSSSSSSSSGSSSSAGSLSLISSPLLLIGGVAAFFVAFW